MQREEPAAAPRWAWGWSVCSRAALVGLTLSLVGQLCVLVLDAPVLGQGPSWMQRISGALVTALVYGALLLVVGLATWAGPGKVWRLVAVGGATAAVSGLVAYHMLSVVVRVLSGTYVTYGAVQFCVGSPEHLSHMALQGYPGYLGLYLAASGAFGMLAGWHLWRAAARAQRPRWGHGIAVSAALVVASMSLVFVPDDSEVPIKRFYDTSPELAFFRSIRQASGLRDYAAASWSFHPVPKWLPGPPMAAQEPWDRAVSTRPGPRPNVLLVVLESISVKHLGHEGYGSKITPNLDAIAAQGWRARRAWSTATHSNYAQMAILSSLFPRRTWGLDVYLELDYPRVLLHDVFHKLGYSTATISSQDETWQGMKRFQDTGTPTYFWHAQDFRGRHTDTGAEKTVPDEHTVEHAIKWLGRQQEPWSLYVNLQSTHFPYAWPGDEPEGAAAGSPDPATFSYLKYPESESAAVQKRYDRALSYVDVQIGKLRSYVEQSAGSTLWVITSDHGEMFHEHGLVTHGKSLYEGESRVPLIFYWPGHLEPALFDGSVSHLDIMPTVLDLVGVPPHPSYQGRSLLASGGGQSGVYMNTQGLRSLEALVCWPWKLVFDRTGSQAYLFDLENDPDEEANLAHVRQEIAASMASVLIAQLDAQHAYHDPHRTGPRREFQPRMVSCPIIEEAVAGSLDPERSDTATSLQ